KTPSYTKSVSWQHHLTLLHNYAWIMSSETTAFQERYDFNIDEWRAKFRQLCLEYFGDSRTQFT
ncbi:hypothetical protein ACVD1I_06555, partial [Escherichia coli]